MLDLYLVLLPLYAIITIINLIYLKLAIKDNVTLLHIHEKHIATQHANNQQEEEGHLKRCAKYFLKNFTVLEFFTVGRGKYKLSLLLSVSAISMATFYISSPFIFAFAGTAAYLVYFLLAVNAANNSAENEEEESKAYREKYIQVTYTLASIIINFLLIGAFYKNYKNTHLRSFISNCGINLALDNFAVRPLVCLLFSLPFSRNEKVTRYIEQEQKNVALL